MVRLVYLRLNDWNLLHDILQSSGTGLRFASFIMTIDLILEHSMILNLEGTVFQTAHS